MYLPGSHEFMENIISKQKPEGKYYNIIKIHREEIPGEEDQQYIEENDLKSLEVLYMIHPKDKRKLAWDSFMGVLVVFSVITIPLQVSFASIIENEAVAFPFFVIDFITSCFFAVDILVNFRTVYYSSINDSYVAIPKFIAWNYITTWFLLDLLATVPLFADIVSLSMNNSFAANQNLFFQYIQLGITFLFFMFVPRYIFLFFGYFFISHSFFWIFFWYLSVTCVVCSYSFTIYFNLVTSI